MVYHRAHNSKSEVFKPTTGTGNEKNGKSVLFICCAAAEEWYNTGLIILKASYSNPPQALGERDMAKVCFLLVGPGSPVV
jgi:hypothetical protein